MVSNDPAYRDARADDENACPPFHLIVVAIEFLALGILALDELVGRLIGSARECADGDSSR